VTALREQAAPVLAAIGEARDAFTMLADLVGPALARDAVTAIVNAGDRVIDWSVLNWWAAYSYPELICTSLRWLAGRLLCWACRSNWGFFARAAVSGTTVCLELWRTCTCLLAGEPGGQPWQCAR
jgi:hypothetical protein